MILVGVDAQVSRYGQGFLDDLHRCEVGVLKERTRGGMCVRAAAANGSQSKLRLDHISSSGNDEGDARVGHYQHGFQPAQDAVGTPVFRQLHCGTHEVALMFLQLAFKSLEQGEGIGRATSKPGKDLVMIKSPHFSGACLRYHCTQRDLAISAKRDLSAAARRKYCSATKFLHCEA